MNRIGAGKFESGRILRFPKIICLGFCLFAGTAVVSLAQTFTSLASFDGANGAHPSVIYLVQGTDGNLYGTTYSGGAHRGGTVFKVTPTGTLAALYSFCAQSECTDGAHPVGGLVLGTDGNFYGTTYYGGYSSACGSSTRTASSNYGCGTVFKITPSGTLTTLHSFDSTDGSFPWATLTQATNGNFYGTTREGGAYDACQRQTRCGTVFEITPTGAFTLLHSFDLTDGARPYDNPIQAINGTFYGTAYEGGVDDDGTVFSITTEGTLTTLHSFNGFDGYCPNGALVQATNGDFYGTVTFGGAKYPDSYGTVFKIRPGGKLITLHSFDAKKGQYPLAALIQANNGDFYGTTVGGGTSTGCATHLGIPGDGCGTVFEITSAGTLRTVHNFHNGGMAGNWPAGGLVQATSGTLYGTTGYGGAAGDGTVFSLAVDLDPFVVTLPVLGLPGAAVTILGTNLTGATRVTFNGTAAKFTVNSTGTAINTTVPGDATSGKVQVTTPSGTLSSNIVFRVR